MLAQRVHPPWVDSILEAIPDPVVVMRPSGEILSTNAAADRLFGVGEGRPQVANRARIVAFVAELVAGHRPLGTDTLLIIDPHDGVDLPMVVMGRRAVWISGEGVVIVTLRRDMAEKTLLLANLSHEVRTPLNAVLGYTSLLLQG